jgi:hypothetical protein
LVIADFGLRIADLSFRVMHLAFSHWGTARKTIMDFVQ